MISYRTLLFGTIAVVAAAAPAAPALADYPIAQPLRIGVRAPHDYPIAQPLATRGQAGPSYGIQSPVMSFVETFVQFEDTLLRISL
jgi:hypothetical protein